jgi:uncharacterized protein YbbC (DUF1343 family)
MHVRSHPALRVFGAAAVAVALVAVVATAAASQQGRGNPPGPELQLGLERLLDGELDRLEGSNVGIITNPTGVNRDLEHVVDLLVAAEDEGGFEVTALYAPEHGIRGGAEAGEHVESYVDERTGLTVWSLYGATQKPTEEMLEDVDLLIFDIQDIGTRFYTYIWTMYYAMEAAHEQDKGFLVLDRPNPLGTAVEGPILDEELSSFVGLRAIPLRHGMTVGELARLFDGEFFDGAVDLDVVEMKGYHPRFFDTWWGQEWVLQSPNMPTQDTAYVYPGMGLMESVNYSEGRGTTKPFEFVGAPWIGDVEATQLADDLNARGLPGVTFRPAFLTPSFSWHDGEMSGGVQVHVTDPHGFESVRTGLHVLDALFAFDETEWRENEPGWAGTCETEDDICCSYRLSGDRDVRLQLDAGVDPDEIVASYADEVEAYTQTADQYRLYQQR